MGTETNGKRPTKRVQTKWERSRNEIGTTNDGTIVCANEVGTKWEPNGNNIETILGRLGTVWVGAGEGGGRGAYDHQEVCKPSRNKVETK